MRKLIINNELWHWKCSSAGNILIKAPNNKKHYYDASQFTGWSHDLVEQAIYKRYYSIKPKDVSEFIKLNFYKAINK